MLSLAMLLLIREPEGSIPTDRPQSFAMLLRQIPQVWRNSPHMRRVTLVAWMLGLGGLVWPFYSIYGIERFHLPVEAGAVFIWASTIGNISTSPVWAWLNDKRGPRLVLICLAGAKTAAPALVLAMPLLLSIHPSFKEPYIAQYVYALVFFASGALVSGTWMGFTNYLLELAAPQERPFIIGMGNTLSAPVLLAPMLGGWLASIWSYEGVFVITLIVAIAGFVISLRLKDPGVDKHPLLYIPPESAHISG